MAIGIGQAFGIYCPENFNYPYVTASVSEFWRRWHISLGAWFKEYIYFPLGGSRVKSKVRLYFNLLVVWTLAGIWYGANWNFVAWGLFYFVLIAFEKTTGWPQEFKTKVGKAVYRILTLLFINFQWVLFNSADLYSGLRYIKHMLISPANALADRRIMVLLGEYGVFLVAAVIFATPIIPSIKQKTENNKALDKARDIVFAVALGCLLYMSTENSVNRSLKTRSLLTKFGTCSIAATGAVTTLLLFRSRFHCAVRFRGVCRNRLPYQSDKLCM